MSLFDRFIARRRPWWVTLLIFMVLLVIPLAAIALDGAWKDVVSLGLWRPVLLAPVVISYVLAVAPAMAKSSADMLEAFRPLVKLDGQAFDQQVRGSSLAETVRARLIEPADRPAGLDDLRFLRQHRADRSPAPPSAQAEHPGYPAV
jgi:hypothetical protein